MKSASRRTHEWNHVSTVPPINAKIAFVDCEHGKGFVKLAHSDEAQICKIRIAVSVAFREAHNLTEIFRKIKGKL